MLYIGADHRGFGLKKIIKIYLTKLGYSFKDLGNTKLDKTDDYPDFAKLVALAVSKNPEKNRGIVICGSGAGVCITANKIKKIRAGLATNVNMAKAEKADDNINVLCIAADSTTAVMTKKIIKTWLSTKFAGYKRYKRRIKKIIRIENRKDVSV